MKWRWIVGFLLLAFFVADTVIVLRFGEPFVWNFDLHLLPGGKFWRSGAYEDLVWSIPALVIGVALLRSRRKPMPQAAEEDAC